MRKNILRSLMALIVAVAMLVSQPVFANAYISYTINLLNGKGCTSSSVYLSKGSHTNIEVYVVSGPGSTVSISYWATNKAGARVTDSSTATMYGVTLDLALRSGYKTGGYYYLINAALTASSGTASKTVIKIYEA